MENKKKSIYFTDENISVNIQPIQIVVPEYQEKMVLTVKEDIGVEAQYVPNNKITKYMYDGESVDLIITYFNIKLRKLNIAKEELDVQLHKDIANEIFGLLRDPSIMNFVKKAIPLIKEHKELTEAFDYRDAVRAKGHIPNGADMIVGSFIEKAYLGNCNKLQKLKKRYFDYLQRSAQVETFFQKLKSRYF